MSASTDAGRGAARRATTRSLLTGGAEKARDLPIDGRDLAASTSPWTSCRSRTAAFRGEPQDDAEPILADGKHVVVIGGGDTGSDCIGTSFRQGAVSVTQLEIMPQPPVKEDKLLTWPNWPLKLRTSSSQEEGAERDFSVMTQQFSGRDGRVKRLHCVRVDDKLQADPRHRVRAEGRPRAARHGLRRARARGHDQGARRSSSTRAATSRPTPIDYRTSHPKVFAAGDMRRGQSLVVWAIREGRQAAHAVDEFLMGETTLPR